MKGTLQVPAEAWVLSTKATIHANPIVLIMPVPPDDCDDNWSANRAEAEL